MQPFRWVTSSWVRSLVIGLGLLIPFPPAQAASVAIDTLTINNIAFTFSVTGFAAFSRSGDIAPVTVAMGTYQDPIVTGSFSSVGTWKIYSAGVAGTPPPPSGAVDASAGSINVDFSSLRGNARFPIFGSSATLDLPLWPLTTPSTANSYNPLTNTYSLSWNKSFSKTITLGSFSQTFNGTTNITLGGVVKPVPLPGAIWFLGSGIVGLVTYLRRRRTENI